MKNAKAVWIVIMKAVAAIIIVITRNTEEEDVAGDVKQLLPRIIKSEVVSLQSGTTSLFMRKGAMSPYVVIPTNGILNKTSQIFNWQSAPFKCRFIPPGLLQSCMKINRAFCRMPSYLGQRAGCAQSPRDFLKNKFYCLFPFLTLYPVHRHHTHPPPTRKTNT